MEMSETYRQMLEGKKVPILILDQKWHRLFAVHGKPKEVSELEKELTRLLALQGKYTTELKSLKNQKNNLMESIVQNMEEDQEQRALQKDKLDLLTQSIEEHEDQLLELPKEIRQVNEDLMVVSMGYFYEKLRINKEESDRIGEWIAQVRIDLKKNIIRKQNRDINNREMYSYLHDLLGPEVLEIFDQAFEEGEKKD